MSKKKLDRTSGGQKRKRIEVQPEAGPDAGRRKLILIGAGTLAATGLGAVGAYRAGWFGSSRSSSPSSSQREAATMADHQTALSAANEMLERHARELGNASVLIHAVRGFGKNFKLADGSKAVDHLCSRYAVDKEVNGKHYVYFLRGAEVHENSFLKTFLEAGVSLDQPAAINDRKYTLRDLAESGKALFRCDPKDLFRYDDVRFRYDPTFNEPRQTPAGQPAEDRGELIHEHLPWGLIAFSTWSPGKSAWTNAYGETIDLAPVIDRAMAEYEGSCALGRESLMRGEPAPKSFRDEIKKYSCFGLHSAYGFLACVKNGYVNDDLPGRAKRMMDLLTYRLKGDAEAIDQEYAQAAGTTSAHLVEAFKLRARVKLFGHAFEAINYARLHNLVTFTAAQERRIQAGERAFYDSLVKMRALDWEMMRKSLGEKFVSDIVIALGHAARAMKLLTPQNPDAIA
ncbi:MAG TPA: hypothetical protein VKE91_11315 [Blastocatellia bacterium]|nr:hypothetical protein [Blastocatellia bacterium]